MATALGGLVIIGVMIAGVFFTSNQELRVGTNTFVEERAFRAAEFGLNASLASWDITGMVLLPIGGRKQIVYDSSARGWRDSVTITRLNATGYMIVSTGTAFGGIQGRSRRRTALLVRLSAPIVDIKAALTLRGTSTVGRSSLVSGVDASPPTWSSCLAPGAPIAGLAAVNNANLFVCRDQTCLTGTPKLLDTPKAADSSTYFNYGDESWASLTKNATKVYSGDLTLSRVRPSLNNDGSCNRNDTENWGVLERAVPAHPCENYFPIIHAKGASSKLTLKGGEGQGVLLVDGNLELAGFSFNGIVVVRGAVTTSGSGGNIKGALMAANIYSGVNDFTAGSFTYSRCAINTALSVAVPPKRVVERAWMELF